MQYIYTVYPVTSIMQFADTAIPNKDVCQQVDKHVLWLVCLCVVYLKLQNITSGCKQMNLIMYHIMNACLVSLACCVYTVDIENVSHVLGNYAKNRSVFRYNSLFNRHEDGDLFLGYLLILHLHGV